MTYPGKAQIWLAGLVLAGGVPAAAAPVAAPAFEPTYADMAILAESAPSVLWVEVRSVAVVEPARTGKLAPGVARLYVQARPLGVLAGMAPGTDVVRYLIDLPTDAQGKPPALKKQQFLLFARPVPGAVGELQLVAPGAQWPWSQPLEARVRSVLADVTKADAPPRLAGVGQVVYQAGTLAGEGETQIFLTTRSGAPASITVAHRPGEPTQWAVSYSEVVAAAAKLPPRDTLAWYRLACYLPEALPLGANVSAEGDDRNQAEVDYAQVRRDLGGCNRTAASR